MVRTYSDGSVKKNSRKYEKRFNLCNNKGPFEWLANLRGVISLYYFVSLAIKNREKSLDQQDISHQNHIDV